MPGHPRRRPRRPGRHATGRRRRLHVRPGDAHAQTLRCYQIIENALRELGLDKTAILRVRLYVTDIARSHEFGMAHKQFFDGHIPCMTMVEVSRLIDPDMLVEIEADAQADIG